MRSFLMYIFFSIITVAICNAGNKKDKNSEAETDGRTTVIKAHELAVQHDKAGKTKKAIVDLEGILGTAKSCGDVKLLEKTYEYLITYNQKIGAEKKVEEYKFLLHLVKTAVEKQALEGKNKEKDREVNKLKAENELAEEEIKIAEEELLKEKEELLETRDSLDNLDRINKERQARIDLMQKEKAFEDLKVKEQEARLKNQEFEIKAKDANQKFFYLIMASLAVGLIVLSVLAYFINKSLQQKKKYSGQIEEQLQVIQHQHQSITYSINYASKIQNAMLPHEKVFHHLFKESFILFKPKDTVSGDFYWFFNVNTGNTLSEFDLDKQANENEKIIVVAADCTGHGVPGALMSMIGYNLLNMIAHKNIHEPDQILTELNRSVRFALQQYKNDNKDGMDMALCIIDRKKKVIEFAGAKNPMIVIKNGQLEHFKGDKHSIGGSQGEAHRTFSKQTVPMDGDTYVYMFTDGYEDQFGGPDSRKFMVKNLKELLLKIHQEPFNKQKEILDKTLEDWKGTKEKQIDDVLVMGMKVC